MATVAAARTVGFLVNPIAGMGGEVALKGTDGPALAEAVARGARPRAPGRAAEFARIVGRGARPVRWVTCAGPMGANALESAGVAHVVVFEPADAVTTPEDTRRACREIEAAGAEAVLFVGGDGTARDVLAALGQRLPVLGVPSGVKMHSGVFALSPSAAARILRAFLDGEARTVEGDVLDEDEEDIRAGRLRVRLAGHARCLSTGGLLQAAKGEYAGEVEEASKQGIADALLERMDEGTLYLFGPGTTPGAVMAAMGLPHTPLGVDIVRGGALVRKDATAAEIEEEVARHGGPKEMVVTAVGRQGFVFGRGNLQLTPATIRAFGKDRITVVAAEEKVAALDELYAETGDPALDRELAGHWRVLCGYRFHVLLPMRAASSPE